MIDYLLMALPTHFVRLVCACVGFSCILFFLFCCRNIKILLFLLFHIYRVGLWFSCEMRANWCGLASEQLAFDTNKREKEERSHQQRSMEHACIFSIRKSFFFGITFFGSGFSVCSSSIYFFVVFFLHFYFQFFIS